MRTMLRAVLATALLTGGITIAPAQNQGGGQTVTPQTAPNPDDPAVRNPQSPTASNRGDPGSEAINPQTGGPAIGQGQRPPATVGQAPADREVVPPNAQPDDAAKPVAPREVSPGSVGAGSRTVPPEGSRNDPHTQGGKDAPVPDPTRPTMAPTQGR
jgi:hypothetical protein